MSRDTAVRLSILDQSPVIHGHSARDAIAATVDLAQMADALGYTRYWCAEHHGLRGVSNPAPEVMIARVASATRHLRVGSGGVMLPYYSPFKLAEQFRLLEALFPNRIDLGVGRAPGGDMRTAQAVAMGDYNRGDHFPQQVQELIWHLSCTLPPDHPTHGVILQPEIDTRPELWLLGSSDFGGALAARLGIRFAFAHFINPHVGHIVAQQYRTDFAPGFEPRPYSAAAVFVIAADTEAEARRCEARSICAVCRWRSGSTARFRPSNRPKRTAIPSATRPSSRANARAASSAPPNPWPSRCSGSRTASSPTN